MRELRCPLCDSIRHSVVYAERLDGAEDAFHYLTERPCHYRIVRCLDCGQVYSTPIFDEDRIAALYRSCRIDAAAAAGEDKAIRVNMRRYLKRLRSDSGLSAGRLLDVGCGLGQLLEEAQRLGYESQGVDLSAEAVAHANRRLGRSGAICAGYARDLFAPRSFDLITLVHVIDHVVSPHDLLETARLHLRPGGYIFIATHNIESYLARLTGKDFIAWSVQHIAYFTPETLQKMARIAGFSPVSVRGSLTTYPLRHYAENGIRRPGLRRGVLSALRALGLSELPLSFPFGNLEVVCREAST
jgi:2-polyprenyl-3-methyl-5-hydroxy-6-metoxy-1,4-benzoquinol methylase